MTAPTTRLTPGPKPAWLKVPLPAGEVTTRLGRILRERGLHTVCEEARCPNIGECWAGGTATFMVLGEVCTRGCRFCAVKTKGRGQPVDAGEPQRVADAALAIGLRYVVLTMVDRDDLIDGGAVQVARTVLGLRERCPGLLVETLVGDFRGRLGDVDTVLGAGPDVFAHNVEVVRRITPVIRDARCRYDTSLAVLAHAKSAAPERLVKSSIMVGIGEEPREVEETLADLRSAGVDIVTLGQYLRPTPKHAPVARWVTPSEFSEYERLGQGLGFLFVASGALVRSSYHAAEGFVAARLRDGRPAEPEPPRANLLPVASLLRGVSLGKLR